MRLAPLAIALVGCARKPESKPALKDDTGSAAGSGLSTTAAKLPPDPSRPAPLPPAKLPELAADPGGATGKPIWATGFGGLGIDAARDIAVEPSGESYVVGYFDGEAQFGSLGKKTSAGMADAFVTKLGPDGKLAWVQTFGAKRDDTANGVAVRGNTVVVVGNFLDELKAGEFPVHKAAGSDDLFVMALNRAGEVQWLWTAGGLDSDGANCVAAAPDGGWIVGGSFSDGAQFGQTRLVSRGGTDAMLIKLAADGDVQWVKQFGGAYADSIQHVAVDAQGSIYVQGQFKDVSDWGGPTKLKAGGGSDDDVVLAKYDANGNFLWAKRFGNAFNDVAGGLTVDPAGNVTMTGSFDKSVSFGDGDDHNSLGESDIFVARFSTDGTLEWAKTYGAEREDIGFGIASDKAGNTVTVGWFQHAVDFGKGVLTSKGNKDVFALKLDAKGNTVWSERWGDHDHDQARAVALDDKGDAYVTGIFRFKLDLVDPPLDSTRADGDRIPKPDVFVVKLDR
jgi:hypothetical protein